MTRVQVWALNEGVGWFRYRPIFEVPTPREDAVRAVREHVHMLLQGTKRRTGFRPSAVAYEVVRADG